MPKIKKARVGIKIDMTPMVDVAFLLLTFFMLTTQFRPQEDVSVIIPSSHSVIKLPETDVMTVTVTGDGTIHLGLDSQQLRAAVFGPEHRLKLSTQVADKETLAKLMIDARIRNPKLRTVVKADKAAPYGAIEDVMNTLQKTNITRFNLVTDIEKS